MTSLRIMVCTYLAIASALLISCSLNDNGFPYVAVVVGEASLIKSQKERPLEQMRSLKPGDIIKVSGQSKVKILCGESDAVYLNTGSIFQFEGRKTASVQGGRDKMHFSLRSGEIHVALHDTSPQSPEFFFAATRATLVMESGDCAFSYDPDATTISLFVLSGIASIVHPDRGPETVPPCTRYVLQNSATGQLLPFSEQEIVRLKNWVGRTAIEAPLAELGCITQFPTGDNLPPEWRRNPQEICNIGVQLVDTVVAIDPENRAVRYLLVDGPAGMILDPVAGIMRFQPFESGTYHITIRATDDDSRSIDLAYNLTITAGLAALLSVPRSAEPGEQFSVSISPVRRGGIHLQGLQYRFDLNGDGTFDHPASGNFGKESLIASCSFPKEGTFVIKGEIRDAEGRTASAARKIIINSRPKANIVVSPSPAAPSIPVLLDARACADNKDSSGRLSIRWDLDGDGAWDVPARGNFSTEKTLTHAWKQPGRYRVVVEVRDTDGSTDTASSEVIVSQGVMPDSIAGPDSVKVGETVTLDAKASDALFRIVSYAWNFNNDSIFEVQNPNSTIRRSFIEPGTRTIACKMTNEIGQSAVLHKTIAVIALEKIPVPGAADTSSLAAKAPPGAKPQKADPAKPARAVDAKGPYRTKVNTDTALVEVTEKSAPVARAGDDIIARANRKLKLKGSGEDRDGKITKYEWDFDADGVYDWSSASTGTVEHQFGDHARAVLRVTDTDSLTACDTIRVAICPADMVMLEKAMLCIDQFEWPNKKGIIPETGMTFEDARASCAKAGKRLCTSSEWEMACSHEKESWGFPYGNRYDLERCNTAGNPFVKNKLSASGLFTNCAGPAGVMDMSGNVAEWVDTETAEPDQPYVYGGSWQNGEDGSGCRSRVKLQKGRKYFYVGFRCCK